ncbi:Homeobox protein GHOX-7-like protein, partial [Dinothrombium tinctorium]
MCEAYPKPHSATIRCRRRDGHIGQHIFQRGLSAGMQRKTSRQYKITSRLITPKAEMHLCSWIGVGCSPSGVCGYGWGQQQGQLNMEPIFSSFAIVAPTTESPLPSVNAFPLRVPQHDCNAFFNFIDRSHCFRNSASLNATTNALQNGSSKSETSSSEQTKRVSNFTIDAILSSHSEETRNWTNCSINTQSSCHKQSSCKRKATNRGPRIPFTNQQISALEKKFKETHYLSSCEVIELSQGLNLTEAR